MKRLLFFFIEDVVIGGYGDINSRVKPDSVRYDTFLENRRNLEFYQFSFLTISKFLNLVFKINLQFLLKKSNPTQLRLVFFKILIFFKKYL